MIQFTTADVVILNIMDGATGISFTLYIAANFGTQVLNVQALEAAVMVCEINESALYRSRITYNIILTCMILSFAMAKSLRLVG